MKSGHLCLFHVMNTCRADLSDQLLPHQKKKLFQNGGEWKQGNQHSISQQLCAVPMRVPGGAVQHKCRVFSEMQMVRGVKTKLDGFEIHFACGDPNIFILTDASR